MTVTVDLARLTSPQRHLLAGWLRENDVPEHVAREPITIRDDRIHYTAFHRRDATEDEAEAWIREHVHDDLLYGVPASAPLTVPLPEWLRDLAVEEEP